MTPFLIGGVFIAIALTVLNLVLTVGVIRRLRELSAPLDAPDLMVGVGATPDAFTADTTDGERVSRETLIGEQLVGFFSPGCGPCRELVPRFVARAAAVGRTHAVAVIAVGTENADEYVAQMEPVARVVVERDADDGGVSRAFHVEGFPAVALLNAEKVVTATGTGILDAVEPSRVP